MRACSSVVERPVRIGKIVGSIPTRSTKLDLARTPYIMEVGPPLFPSKMSFSTKKLGDLGERIAIDYLKKKGYQILAQNYVPKFADLNKAEIDIVAKKEGVIAFIEVKTLSGNSPFLPQDKVDYAKQKKIIKAAKFYLSEKKLAELPWQIDVVSLKINSDSQKAKIWHLKNAVSES